MEKVEIDYRHKFVSGVVKAINNMRGGKSSVRVLTCKDMSDIFGEKWGMCYVETTEMGSGSMDLDVQLYRGTTGSPLILYLSLSYREDFHVKAFTVTTAPLALPETELVPVLNTFKDWAQGSEEIKGALQRQMVYATLRGAR